VGVCVHELLEHVDLAQVTGDCAAWAARPDVQELTRRAAVKAGVPARHGELVAALAHRALTTPLALAGGALLPGVAALGAQALRELEFTYPIPERDHPPLLPPPSVELTIERGWIRGYMDLVFRHDGRGYVADWKTNRLPDYAPAPLRELVARDYDLQRKIYALALSKMLGVTTAAEHEARFGGVLFLFLRGLRAPLGSSEGAAPGVVFDRPGFDELQAYERELREFPAYRHGWDPAWAEEA
jgi:exodeoxyribonuclease V beta subunit